MLLIEVKGGLIEYNGEERRWYQNGSLMRKDPYDQVISCVSSLLKRYPEVKKKIPVGWALCFPQCEIANDSEIPTNLNRDSIIDQRDLLNASLLINKLIKNTKQEYNYKSGLKDFEYKRLRQQLLRGLGFVQRLSTQIEVDEKMFVKLTDEQFRTFHQATDNTRLVVNGPAGSGKTIIAKELAKEFLEKGNKVLLLCFNRVLASSLRQEFHRIYSKDSNIEVSTFHHFARMQISDDNWFKENKKEEDFWELLLPAKLESIPDDELTRYDAIILDEGQDFKEFWFELLERHLNPDGFFYVFLDSNQDIFNHYTKLPNEQKFVRFRLNRNCRNSQKVIQYLTANTSMAFEHFDETPAGSCIIRKFKNNTEQVKLIRDDAIQLIEQDGILPRQILILIHSDKRDSCLSNVQKLGKYQIKSAYRLKDVRDNDIMYATIEIFKGLESDVVLLADTHLLDDNEIQKKIYVEASRAKHRLYVYERIV